MKTNENLVTDKVITTKKEMYDLVWDEYQKYDTELNGLFFNFNVKMPKGEILEAYSMIQKTINGDDVIRMVNGKEQKYLIPKDKRRAEFTEEYEGNCKDYLENLNGSREFVRVADDEIVDFIF